MAEIDYVRLLYLLLLAAAVGGLVYAQFRGRLGDAMRMAVTWAMIFFGTIAAYGLWQDFRNAAAPLYVTSQSENAVAFRRQPDGHFYAGLAVNGHVTRFLIDTGASGIVLSRRDAAAAGIDPGRLRYSGRASTANGIVRTAPVRIDELQLGSFVNRRVPASVTDSDLDVSLLGQSYLSQFDKVVIEGDILTLQAD